MLFWSNLALSAMLFEAMQEESARRKFPLWNALRQVFREKVEAFAPSHRSLTLRKVSGHHLVIALSTHLVRPEDRTIKSVWLEPTPHVHTLTSSTPNNGHEMWLSGKPSFKVPSGSVVIGKHSLGYWTWQWLNYGIVSYPSSPDCIPVH